MGRDEESWREDRRLSSEYHAREVNRRRQAESRQAQRLVDDFVRAARERGIAPQPLRALSYSSGARYRTGLVGWYIRKDRTLAIDVHGNFYVLTVPGGLLTRLTGASLVPAAAPLVVGLGSRDGDSCALAELLQDVLQRG